MSGSGNCIVDLWLTYCKYTDIYRAKYARAGLPGWELTDSQCHRMSFKNLAANLPICVNEYVSI